MRFKIVFAPVKTHKTDAIVDAAKAAGATGATIIPARGTGMHEAKTFFGLTLEDPTDIVLFLLEEHIVKTVLEAVRTAGEFDKPGTGIAFVLPVEEVLGLGQWFTLVFAAVARASRWSPSSIRSWWSGSACGCSASKARWKSSRKKFGTSIYKTAMEGNLIFLVKEVLCLRRLYGQAI